MKNDKILLVDDEEDFTSALSERLENRGLKVVSAESGMEAVRKVKEEHFDAIVLDMLMPEMDGIETLKQLLNNNPDLQIILLTGHATVSKGVEAMKHGAMEFLEKPVDIDKLMKHINEAKTQRILLAEKKLEEKTWEILKKYGW